MLMQGGTGMSDRYFRVFSGLLTPAHRKRIGTSLWTFLWLIDHITDETIEEDTGQRSGLVLYGNRTTFNDIGEDLGMSKSTIKDHCETLQKEGYISMEVTPRGNKFTVLRSKKWNNPSNDRSGNRTKRSENSTNRAEKRTTENIDRAENRTEGSEDRTLRSEIPLSNTNKDTLKEKLINNNKNSDLILSDLGLLDGQQPDEVDLLVNYFQKETGRLHPIATDYGIAKKILEQIPLDHATQLIPVAISKINERKPGAKIHSLSYCLPVMQELYEVYLAREKARKDKVISLSSRAVQKPGDNSESFALAQLLFDEIRKVQSDFSQPDLNLWALEIENLISAGKKPESIRKAIMYARTTDFWMSKIYSPEKLAKHYDTLQQQMIAGSTNKSNVSRKNQWRAPEPSWLNGESETHEPDPSEQEKIDKAKAEMQLLMAERNEKRKQKGKANGGY